MSSRQVHRILSSGRRPPPRRARALVKLLLAHSSILSRTAGGYREPSRAMTCLISSQAEAKRSANGTEASES